MPYERPSTATSSSQFWVTVFGMLFNSNYTLTASSAGVTRRIVADSPILDGTDSGTNRLYSLDVPAGSTFVSISVTAVTGDPGQMGLGVHQALLSRVADAMSRHYCRPCCLSEGSAAPEHQRPVHVLRELCYDSTGGR